MWSLFLPCIALRLTVSLFLRTAFAPDEFWQGPEVAHRMVFGYGHLTWEWATGLRSYCHPTLYAVLYWLLQAVGCDTAVAVAKGPQLLHGLIAAAADVTVLQLSKELHGEAVARWTLLCQLASWFNAYCLTRTYSSSVEAGLTAVVRWMILAALCCVLRPPSVLFWAAAAVVYVMACPYASRWRVIHGGLFIAGFVLASNTVWDRMWYGRWVFVPWRFLTFNLLSGGSAMYGSHPWHWNFTIGLPAVLASYLPFLLVGLVQATPLSLLPAKLAMVQLLAYSLPAHKEFRFLLPALQILMPYCGLGAAQLAARASSWHPGLARKGTQPAKPSRGKLIAITLIVCQIPMAGYLCLFHQRAQIGVMTYLRKQALVAPRTTSILFLTPCHATPYYSFLHTPVRMRFLDCSPPGTVAAVQRLNEAQESWLKLPQPISGTTERDVFEAKPVDYVTDILLLNKRDDLPMFIVTYSAMGRKLASVLGEGGYRIDTALANCWVPGDESSECSIDVWMLS